MRPSLRPRVLAYTFFLTGLSPFAPGTVASVAAAALLLLLPSGPYPFLVLGFVVLGSAVAPALARAAEAEEGADDPSWFVLDEAVGVWIACFRFERPRPAVLLVALVAFRLFDIIKPFPIGRLEAVPRGFGVLLDDVAAGALALAASLVIQKAFL